MSQKDITDKAKAFCEEYLINWFNARQAYKKAYWQEDDQKASISACQLLKDGRVQDYIESLEGTFRISGYKAWITKDTLIAVLADMLKAEKTDMKWVKSPDWTARHNAIMDFTRLTGDLTEKKNIKITWDEENDETAKDMKEMTFKELIEHRNKVMADL